MLMIGGVIMWGDFMVEKERSKETPIETILSEK